MKIEINGFQFKGFLNTPFGSFVKVFFSAMAVRFMAEGGNLLSFDMNMLHKLINTGAMAVLPVIINFLNPNDPRYGKGKDINLEPKPEDGQ